MYYRAIKFRQRAVLILTLEINAADISFYGHSENLQCLFKYDATKPDVIDYKICEGTDCLKAAISSGVSSLHVMVASARGVSIEADSWLYLVP
jgi:hypothetical protein